MSEPLTSDQAIRLLMGEGWNGKPAASWRSGADIAAGLASHFGLDADAYTEAWERWQADAARVEADKQLPEGTVLVCPGCGHDTFTAWAPTDTGYHGVRIHIENHARVEDDSGVYDTEASDGIGLTEEFSCLGCGEVFDLGAAVPPPSAV